MAKFERNESVAIQVMLEAGFKPVEKYMGCQKPWKCECLKCGFIFTTTYFKVRNRDLRNCPSCRIEMLKDFALQAEELMISAGLTPLEPYPGRNDVHWKSRCARCGSNISPAFNTVRSGGGGCKFCGVRASSKAKKIPQERAASLMIKANLKPLEPYVSARSKWKCECLNCGEVVYPTYNGIQQGEGGCAKCARQSTAEKLRTDSALAISVMVEKGLQPLETYVSGSQPWKARCLICGAEVSPSFNNVRFRQRNYGCIYCAGGRVSEEDAIQAMKTAGVNPLVPYQGKDEPWKSRCVKCERVVWPSYANARRGQGGCKYCAEYGIDLVAPAYLYIISHELFNAYKVGVGKEGTTSRNDRISNLSKQGWVLIKKYPFASGLDAQTVEFAIFNELRNVRGIPVFLSAHEMKRTGGYTETIDADRIAITELVRLIEDNQEFIVLSRQTLTSRMTELGIEPNQ